MNVYDTIRTRPIRRTPDKLLGGVCAGLAHRWGISPAVVRLLAILLFLAVGLGLVLYGLAWLFVPEYETEDILAERAIRDPDAGVATAIAMTLIGFVGGTGVFAGIISGWSHTTSLIFVNFAVIGALMVVAFAVLRSRSRRKDSEPRALREPAPAPLSGDGVPGAADGSAMSGAAAPVGRDYPAPSPRKRKRRVRTPAISGPVARIVVAIAIAGSAIALIAASGLIARVLLAFSVGLAIVSLGVLVAGFRGLRATWLTALTWLVGIPTVFLLAASLALPNRFLFAENPRFLNLGGTADELSLIYVSERRPAATFQESLPSSVDTFVYAVGSRLVPEDVPVIYKLSRDAHSFGYATVEYSGIREWKIVHEGEEFMSRPASADGHPNADDGSVIHYPQHLNLLPGETMELHTPEAIERPDEAKIVDIHFYYGEFAVAGIGPSSMTYAEWLEGPDDAATEPTSTSTEGN